MISVINLPIPRPVLMQNRNIWNKGRLPRFPYTRKPRKIIRFRSLDWHGNLCNKGRLPRFPYTRNWHFSIRKLQLKICCTRPHFSNQFLKSWIIVVFTTKTRFILWNTLWESNFYIMYMYICSFCFTFHFCNMFMLWISERGK